ncbi:HigA family addiction module antitoxin [Leyella stercorea]|uniref:HigA family addiction module antitoxin n=1 Tax=Leyella stercorea TaxID=363265 RepID=UPI003F65A107
MKDMKIYSLNNLVPSTPVHPGEIIKDEIEARGISQRKFASIIDCSYTVLNEILNCKRPVTTDYALRIEAALGIKACMLVNMQGEYSLQAARRDNRMEAILSKIRSAAAVF